VDALLGFWARRRRRFFSRKKHLFFLFWVGYSENDVFCSPRQANGHVEGLKSLENRTLLGHFTNYFYAPGISQYIITQPPPGNPYLEAFRESATNPGNYAIGQRRANLLFEDAK